jgi:hypothetical protein
MSVHLEIADLQLIDTGGLIEIDFEPIEHDESNGAVLDSAMSEDELNRSAWQRIEVYFEMKELREQISDYEL